MRESAETEFFGIHLRFSNANVPALGKLFYQQEHNDVYLSPHGLLASQSKMAHLRSQDLGERFLEAYLPRLQARYGETFTATVTLITQHGGAKRLLLRIEQDSNLAEKRLETGILASNRRPE